MSDQRCKCSMAISATGDGCRYCQPQEHIDRLGEWLDEEREELARLQSEVERLWGRCEEAEATVAEHRKALESYEWMVLRKQAEALIEFGYKYNPESMVRRLTQKEAQRLRKKAAESESGTITRKAD